MIRHIVKAAVPVVPEVSNFLLDCEQRWKLTDQPRLCRNQAVEGRQKAGQGWVLLDSQMGPQNL